MFDKTVMPKKKTKKEKNSKISKSKTSRQLHTPTHTHTVQQQDVLSGRVASLRVHCMHTAHTFSNDCRKSAHFKMFCL